MNAPKDKMKKKLAKKAKDKKLAKVVKEYKSIKKGLRDTGFGKR